MPTQAPDLTPAIEDIRSLTDAELSDVNGALLCEIVAVLTRLIWR